MPRNSYSCFLFVCLLFKISFTGAGEVAQELKVLPVLTGVPGLVPSTHMVAFAV